MHTFFIFEASVYQNFCVPEKVPSALYLSAFNPHINNWWNIADEIEMFM